MEGVQAIKRLGGRVIAQAPHSLRYGDMPRAAIGTGAVDYVLELEDIAPALVSLVDTGRANNHPESPLIEQPA
jgi:two-component system chemotaxis response regulator CheB